MDFIKKFSLNIPSNYLSEFQMKKFRQNNLRALLGALILCIEQLLYGIFLSPEGSVLKRCYLHTSATMLMILAVCMIVIRRPPKGYGFAQKLYEVLLVFSIFTIIIVRFKIDSGIRLPTVYVAVLYGCAVLFELSFWQSAFAYLYVTITALAVTFLFSSEIPPERYIADILSNGLIAWTVSLMNYSSFLRMFVSSKKIEEQNLSLIQKNQEIEEINGVLLEQSIRDSLTGLFNRRKLDDLCRHEILKAERYGNDLSIILMDIDHFKNINDSRGHDVGDDVLKKLSAILLQNIREVDACGRWGGEEFLVVCRETDLKHARLLAERLRARIEGHRFSSCRSITASFGVASLSESGGLKELFKIADLRLYDAKRGGRNKVVSGKSVFSGGNCEAFFKD